MANDFSITFPTADLRRFQASLQRAEKELGKSSKQALQWGAITVAKSVGASTRVSPKKRKIVKAWEADGVDLSKLSKAERKLIMEKHKDAPFGVYVYRNGKQVFQPITKLDVPLIVFRSKTTGQLLGRNPRNGQVHSMDYWTASNMRAVKQASNLINIRFSGLCKKAWRWISSNARRSASKGNIADVNWHSSGWAVRLRNLLTYAIPALGGKNLAPVETAMRRAADSMAVKIERAIEAQAKKAVV